MADLTISGTGTGAPLPISTASRIPRPSRTRRTEILTLADAVDRVLRIEEINSSESRAVERAVLAVQSALNSFVSYSTQGFRFYDGRYSLVTSAPITIATITVVSNTVTPGALSQPDWMDMAHLRIAGQSYPVNSYSNSSFTVDGTLPDGTYANAVLERLFYPIPQDFRRRGSFSDNANYYQVIDVPGGVLQSWQDYYDWARTVTSPRVFGAISNDQRFHGQMMLMIWPPYTGEVRLNMFYERYPASCRVHRVGTSTVSTTGRTATALTSVFKPDHVGSVLVVCESNDTDITNPLSSLDLVHAKRIITDYTSGTVVTLDQALDADVATRTFYITDPVDVQPGAQTEAFLRLCEYEFCRQSRSKHSKERYSDFMEALLIAMADDSRYRDIFDDVDSLGDGVFTLGEVTGRPDLA